MITATAPSIAVLKTKDDVLDFILLSIMKNKESLAEPIHAEVDCEDLEGTRLLAEAYKGTEEKGHDFNMPLERPDGRKELERLLIAAKGNPSKSFVTVSKSGFKLQWMVRYRPK